MAKPNNAGVDPKTGKIMEYGFFPKGALKQLTSGTTPSKKPANSKRTSPVTKKGKK